MSGEGRRSEGLDLLRGVAVALVMLRHALPDAFAGAGVVGVVMFFAISGYLITGVLVEEHARTGGVDLRRFYARRARRLVPALVVMVVGVALVTVLLDPLGERDDLGRTVLVALTWTGNLPRLQTDGATFHLWTLATEEQFYLLWPVVLLSLVLRPGRRPGPALLAAGAACLLLCVATVLWLREDPDLAYALPTSWAGCFVVGGAARLLGDRVRLPRGAAVVAVVVLVALSLVELRGHAATYLLVGPAVAVLTAVLVLAWRPWTVVDGPVGRRLVALGTVSYGAYLWNHPLMLWLREVPGGPLVDLTTALLGTVLTVAAAYASHRFVERPLSRPATVAA